MKRLFKFIAQHSIAAKLTAMAVAGALFMLFVALTVLLIARSELASERAERAHAIVDAVWSMADSFKRAADTGAMSEEEAKTRFFTAAGAVWFEGHTNYVFIYDTETGLCVMNTGNPGLIGKDVRELKDAGGMRFASMMLDIARRGGHDQVRVPARRRQNAARQGGVCPRLRPLAPDDLVGRIHDRS